MAIDALSAVRRGELVPVFRPGGTRRTARFISVPLRWLAGYVLILGGLILCPTGARAQISPGPLSKAHRTLDGATQCNSCHQFGASTPTFKCLDCHKEIAQR